MDNDKIAIFKYQDTPVRIIDESGDPWFVAKDVCDILEIANPRDALDRLAPTMKGVATADTLGGKQQLNTISEAGVYKLVFTSRKPEAERFTDWLATEVIPSIRKHGAYMTAETIEKVLADPDTIIRLATDLKEERARRLSLEVEKKIMLPKAEFFDTVGASKDAIPMRDVARVLNDTSMGRNRLFEFLRDQKVLMADNLPYQTVFERGYFRVIEKPIKFGTNGEVRIHKQTLVTQKGLVYINKLIQERYPEWNK